MNAVRILLIEPYYGGSHRAWADGFVAHSQHQVDLLTLPAQFWKWRMQGGAVTMARRFAELDEKPDLILASDMLDLSLFRALTRDSTQNIPIALYFHENQLSYPQNRRQSHGYQYAFINYASALAADAIFFNSPYHMDDFFIELWRMLKHFADYNELQTIEALRERASVLPLGLDLQRFEPHRVQSNDDVDPLIVWNHRWEADKNPRAFFDALYALDSAGYRFRIALLGENFRQAPTEFEQARDDFGARIVQYGYAEDFAHYAHLLWAADYVVSTAHQDFFGIAIAEAMYCGCVPLLANRLNYPDLVPDSEQSNCLFRDGALQGLLVQHLQGTVSVDKPLLRQHVAQYDWHNQIERYDATLDALV